MELPTRVIEFDDLETFEHTKCKPLSVTLAVQAQTRRILGLEVSAMPAKGLLVKKARKYGPRVDRRAEGRERLFTTIKPFVHPEALIKSDANPHWYTTKRADRLRANLLIYAAYHNDYLGK